MTLSNQLTLGRLCLAPVFFILFWIDLSISEPKWTLIISGILIVLGAISEISDAVDGNLARKRKEVTDFGKLFDPFADSVSRFTFFLCFWWAGLFPAWMIILLFYRDASISFLRLVVRGENVVLAARLSGKIKAVSQSIAIFMILLVRMIYQIWPEFPLKLISTSIMAVIVTITVLSFFDYLTSHWHVLKQIKK